MKIHKLSIYVDIIKEHTSIFLYNLLIILLGNLTALYIVAVVHVERIKSEVAHNIYEYEVVDLTHLCRLNNCSYIYYNNTLYKSVQRNNDIVLVRTKEELGMSFSFCENGEVLSFHSIKINLGQEMGGFIVVSITDIVRMFGQQSVFIFLVLLALNVALLITTLTKYHKSKFRKGFHRDNDIYSQSLLVLAENLHHELNTPLAVINGKITKLRKVLNSVSELNYLHNLEGTIQDDLIQSVESDFDLTEASIEQMTDILNRMKNFKILKNKESKSIYKILETVSGMLQVSQAERFECDLDEGLHKYRFDVKKIAVGELIGIFTNLLKNSIDADATTVKVSHIVFDNKIKIFFADNGNGISENNINKIYEEDFSTKSAESRGNGLFINRFLVETAGGSLTLEKTSPEGTIFSVVLPILEVVQ